MKALRKKSLNPFTGAQSMGIIRLFEALVLVGVLFSIVVFMWGKSRLIISLDEVLSIGSLDDDDLFMLVGIVSDSSKRIYVTDAMDYSIKVFDDGLTVSRREFECAQHARLRVIDIIPGRPEYFCIGWQRAAPVAECIISC